MQESQSDSNIKSKIELVFNALPLQDSHRYRAIGRYTYEILSNWIKLFSENHPLTESFSGLTIVAASSPKLNSIVDIHSERVNVVEVPFAAPKRNLFKYLYYKFILNPALDKQFSKLKKDGKLIAYFLPRHQILTHKLADFSVVMVHDLIPLQMQKFSKNPLVNFFLRREYNVYVEQLKTVQMVVANSNDSATIVRKYTERTKDIFPIFLGTSFSKNVTPGKAPLVHRYFVYYGGYEENKNISGIIKAFGKFIRTYSDCNETKIVFIGGKNHSEKILSLARPEGIVENIVLLPTVTDEEIVTYLVHSQGLFRLSLAEGFGLPELEALSLGVPVISSKIPAIMEVTKDFAYLHSTKDEEGIVKDLAMLAHRKTRPENTKEAQTYAQAFTWEKTATNTLEEIAKFIATKHSHE